MENQKCYSSHWNKKWDSCHSDNCLTGELSSFQRDFYSLLLCLQKVKEYLPNETGIQKKEKSPFSPYAEQKKSVGYRYTIIKAEVKANVTHVENISLPYTTSRE